MNTPLVGIIMGSNSDLPVMQEAAKILDQFQIPYEMTVVSAHRTPERMFSYAKEAAGRGIRVIIAGAGGAAHLPGMVASVTPLPVIGVPVKSSNSIDGWDSILSILQMPNGVPVATVALNAAQNAGILAAQMLATGDASLLKKIVGFKTTLKEKVLAAAGEMEKAKKTPATKATNKVVAKKTAAKKKK
jgi:5-(carboxyamino)imidazole ribonucleotide mutase